MDFSKEKKGLYAIPVYILYIRIISLLIYIRMQCYVLHIFIQQSEKKSPHKKMDLPSLKIIFVIQRLTLTIKRLTLAVEKMILAVEKMTLAIEKMTLAVEKMILAIGKMTLATQRMALAYLRIM
jgi:hypothetical protein